MKKIEKIVKSVTIKYFRSINNQRLRNLEQVNVITGGNDIGKSNVIRALKLFFHETNDQGRPISFYDEFSHSRLNAVRQDSIKGKQFIQIEVEFNCVGAFEKTLPHTFKVKKTWFKDPAVPPRIDNDLEKYFKAGSIRSSLTKAEGSLQRFLGSIVFTYVPAIKDRSFFDIILEELQSVLVDQRNSADSSFDSELIAFNTELQKTAEELRSEFKDRTGIAAKIALPTDYRELFRAFKVSTEGDFGDSVSLDSRGDGVRVRFLPAIMNYIAERSKKQHIWGFEEPENSMEYRRAFELSEAFGNTYSKNAQIFITTHSPAFINIHNKSQAVFLALRDGPDTKLQRLSAQNIQDIDHEDPDILIADRLGHIHLMNELREKLDERIIAAEAIQSQAQSRLEELKGIQAPVVLTEGRFDPLILKEAWSRLRIDEMPFAIKSCSVVPEDEGEAAGAKQLSSCLRSILPDHPHLVIGIFDRDEEGLKYWTLDRNFQQSDLFEDVKSSTSGKAFATLLPVPSHEPKLKDSRMHCIEFMFPEAAVKKSVRNRSLELTPQTIVERIGSALISERPGTEFWQMRVTGNKKHFAEEVVPSLGDEDFYEFESLFKTIEGIIEKAKAC